MNKPILIIAGIVLLAVVGGGIFLLLNQTQTKSDLGEPEILTALE